MKWNTVDSNFLRGNLKPTWELQMGVAGSDKRALIWIPGKQGVDETKFMHAENCGVFGGATGRGFEFPMEPMDSQPSYVVWGGVDIDGKDNQNTTVEWMSKCIRIAIPEASIRTSGSGTGLHVIFRFSHPILLPEGCARSLPNQVARYFLAPYYERIQKLGIRTCVWGCRMFWLWGGKNEWLHKSDLFVDTSKSIDLHSLAVDEAKEHCHNVKNLSPFVRGWLEKLKCRVGPVYVGSIVPRLHELGETVVTKSPMSGNNQVNGYIDIGPDWISLWSYADGHEIWRSDDEF